VLVLWSGRVSVLVWPRVQVFVTLYPIPSLSSDIHFPFPMTFSRIRERQWLLNLTTILLNCKRLLCHMAEHQLDSPDLSSIAHEVMSFDLPAIMSSCSLQEGFLGLLQAFHLLLPSRGMPCAHVCWLSTTLQHTCMLLNLSLLHTCTRLIGSERSVCCLNAKRELYVDCVRCTLRSSCQQDWSGVCHRLVTSSWCTGGWGMNHVMHLLCVQSSTAGYL
jgi:hypothetical protein